MFYQKLMARYRGVSSPLRSERLLELAVLVFALALFIQLLYSAVRIMLIATPAAVLPAADALAVSNLQSAGEVTAEQSAEILDRPLFWQSRRRPDASGATAQPVKPQDKSGKLDGVKLLGLFGGGEAGGIIVQMEGKKRRIMQGEKVDGWKLDSVHADKAVFTSGARREELVLNYRSIPEPNGQGNVAGFGAEPGSSGAVPAKSKQKPLRSPTRSPSPGSGGAEDELSPGGMLRR